MGVRVMAVTLSRPVAESAYFEGGFATTLVGAATRWQALSDASDIGYILSNRTQNGSTRTDWYIDLEMAALDDPNSQLNHTVHVRARRFASSGLLEVKLGRDLGGSSETVYGSRVLVDADAPVLDQWYELTFTLATGGVDSLRANSGYAGGAALHSSVSPYSAMSPTYAMWDVSDVWLTTSAPIANTLSVYAGQGQQIVGPAPSVTTLTAAVTPGSKGTDGPYTYTWTQLSGPVGNATINSPSSANTTITFAAYDPGTYVFQVSVTTTTTDGFTFTVTSTVSLTIRPTVAPRVSSGNFQIVWPEDTLHFTATIGGSESGLQRRMSAMNPGLPWRGPLVDAAEAGFTAGNRRAAMGAYSGAGTGAAPPTIEVIDDAWGGALSYAWAQVSGPDVATITAPAALETDVTVNDVVGVYIFSLTVTRADDGLVGIGLQRVTVYTGGLFPQNTNTGLAELTANGVSKCGLIETARISETVGQPSTCSFSMYGDRVEEGNDIVITRGGVRLFGGVCLSVTLEVDVSQVIKYHISCVGYAWHLGRIRVTATYASTSITDIVIALVALAPGGLTSIAVQTGLPTADIAFDDVSLADALNQLAALIHAHWKVDDFKDVHFAIIDTVGVDPLPLSSHHPSKRRIQVTRDISQTVNRVILHYDNLTVKPVLVNASIEVDSLDGYSASGGYTVIDGNTIHYTGVFSGYTTNLYGTVVYGHFTAQGAIAPEGELDYAVPPNPSPLFYVLTLSSAEGETPPIETGGPFNILPPQNAARVEVWDPIGAPESIIRVTGINVYRQSSEVVNGVVDQSTFLVATFPPKGGWFIDIIPKKDLMPVTLAPFTNTADVRHNFLTGCTGSQDVHTPAQVIVEDLTAQGALALLLGGGDSGVIEDSQHAGTMTDVEALDLATNFLNASKAIRKRVSCEVRDDDARAGQNLSMNFPVFPAPFQTADLKIQQSDVSGFTYGLPHYHAVTAADDIVTLDDLLKRT